MTLFTLLVNNQVMQHRFVVVPTELARATGIPEDAHPCHWIPQLDARPPACGEPYRLPTVEAEVWCLRPEGHDGRHW